MFRAYKEHGSRVKSVTKFLFNFRNLGIIRSRQMKLGLLIYQNLSEDFCLTF
jgi:hypothetical protein